MSNALKDRPNAEQLPASTSASVIRDGHYQPPPQDKDGKIWVRTSALIHADANLLYQMWRDIENAPLWQEQIERVIRTGETMSQWVMRASGTKTGGTKTSDTKTSGKNTADKDSTATIEWNSEILADEPGKRIAWRSISGESNNAGEVIFEPSPGGRATMVTVLQEFRLGKLASAWETIVGRNPKQAVIENLRHFKALAETGEIPRTEGQPHGRRGAVAKVKESMYGEKIATPPGLNRKKAS